MAAATSSLHDKLARTLAPIQNRPDEATPNNRLSQGTVDFIPPNFSGNAGDDSSCDGMSENGSSYMNNSTDNNSNTNNNDNISNKNKNNNIITNHAGNNNNNSNNT